MIDGQALKVTTAMISPNTKESPAKPSVRPQTQKIADTKWKPIDNPTVPLASSMTAVRLPQDIHDLLMRHLPDGYQKSAWLRKVIGQAVIAEFAPAVEQSSGPKADESDRRLENAILYLHSCCDGCETQDGAGFNGCDTGFGKWLGNRLANGGVMLKAHALQALKMLQKYRKTQLNPAGYTLPTEAEVRALYGDDLVIKKTINGEVCIPRKRIQLKGENLALFAPYDPILVSNAKKLRGWWNDLKKGGDNSWRFDLDLEIVEAVLRQWPEPVFTHDESIQGIVEALSIEKAEAIARQEAAALSVAESIGSLAGDLDGITFKNGWTLRDYQRKGVEWLLSHGKGRIYRGGILADQMGLGKTLTALVAAKKMQEQTNCKVFVVAPVSLQQVWLRTAEIVELSLEVTTNSYQKIPKPLEHQKYLLIADEAHSYQDPSSKRTKAFLELALHPHCIATWALTGTPVKNGRPINLFPLLMAIEHPLAQDKKTYERHYCNAGYRSVSKGRSIWDTTGASHLEELAQLTRDAILQRTKIECLPELPAKTRLFKEAELSDETERNYREAINSLVADYRARAKQGLVDPDSEALVTLNILRKTGSEAKVESAIALANELLEAGEQVVIFTEFLESAKQIFIALGGELLTGETNPEDRQTICDRFQSGQSKVIVGTIRAGGVGLTLTAASNVILVDRPWTPGDTEQAEDRCHRLGQNSAVFATWLQYGPIDAAIDGLLQLKQERIDIVMKGKKKTLGNIKSPKELARELMDIL